MQCTLPLVLEQVREQILNDSFVPVVSLYKTTHEMLLQLFVGVVYTQLLQAGLVEVFKAVNVQKT